MRYMVRYNKLKCFEKMIENGDRSVITNRGAAAFLKQEQ
jgi:hypothetical protein